jgi:hypothetical protein
MFFLMFFLFKIVQWEFKDEAREKDNLVEFVRVFENKLFQIAVDFAENHSDFVFIETSPYFEIKKILFQMLQAEPNSNKYDVCC